MPDADPVLAALDDLADALALNIEAGQIALQRIQAIRGLRARGLAYRDIVDETGTPLVVQLITGNLDRLRTYGAQLRQAQAAALYEEGLTMDQIANLFGVTRQRISALLRSTREPA